MRDRFDRLGPRTTLLLTVGLALAAGGRLGATFGFLDEASGTGVLLVGGALILAWMLLVAPRTVAVAVGAGLLVAIAGVPLVAGAFIAVSRAPALVEATEAGESRGIVAISALLFGLVLLVVAALIVAFRWLDRRLPGR